MQMVLLTALGVGGATVLGAVIGFLFKDISHKFSDVVLSFAAGKGHIQLPVFLGHKGSYFVFTVNYHFTCNRLYTSCRKPSSYFLRNEG